jgi:hypothetical protein
MEKLTIADYRLVGEKKDKEKFDEVFPVVFNFDNITRPEAEAVWYTRVNGKMARIDCKIKKVHEIATWQGNKKMRQGETYMDNKAFFSKLYYSQRINWWTSHDSHMKVTQYWSKTTDAEKVFKLAD